MHSLYHIAFGLYIFICRVNNHSLNRVAISSDMSPKLQIGDILILLFGLGEEAGNKSARRLNAKL